MTKKLRSDSNSTAGEMLRSRIPEPPEHIHLPDEARPFWDSIMAAKSVDAWTVPDLEQAAELARCKADLERLGREIAEEGDIVDGKVSGRRKLEEVLIRRSITLTRMLQVHALATVGRSGDQRSRNAAARSARNAAESIGDDDLIAGPVDKEIH